MLLSTNNSDVKREPSSDSGSVEGATRLDNDNYNNYPVEMDPKVLSSEHMANHHYLSNHSEFYIPNGCMGRVWI